MTSAHEHRPGPVRRGRDRRWPGRTAGGAHPRPDAPHGAAARLGRVPQRTRRPPAQLRHPRRHAAGGVPRRRPGRPCGVRHRHGLRRNGHLGEGRGGRGLPGRPGRRRHGRRPQDRPGHRGARHAPRQAGPRRAVRHRGRPLPLLPRPRVRRQARRRAGVGAAHGHGRAARVADRVAADDPGRRRPARPGDHRPAGAVRHPGRAPRDHGVRGHGRRCGSGLRRRPDPGDRRAVRGHDLGPVGAVRRGPRPGHAALGLHRGRRDGPDQPARRLRRRRPGAHGRAADAAVVGAQRRGGRPGGCRVTRPRPADARPRTCRLRSQISLVE